VSLKFKRFINKKYKSSWLRFMGFIGITKYWLNARILQSYKS
jgi:hypothetical protein